MSINVKSSFRFLKWTLTAAILLIGAAPQLASAGIIIDGFNPNSPFVVAMPGLGSNGTGTAIGGNRDYFGTKTSLRGAIMAAVQGFGVLSSDASTTATGTMQYDGTPGDIVNPFGLGVGGIDLTQGGLNNQFHLTVGVDLSGYQATLAVWTSGNLFTSSFIVPQGPPTNDVFVSFASFGGANFANVGAIELRLNTGATPVAEADFVITNFSAVPEPSSVLLVLGLVAVGLCPRRKA
jgi:hypothetical protein